MEKTSVQLDKNSQVRRARRLKFLFVAVLFLILIAAGIIGFLRKKQYQITKVQVAGTQALDENLVKKETEKFLEGNYLIVIPKTNALLISKANLRDYLMEEIPSLEHVRIDFSTSNSITVTVTEKKPKYTWCQLEECYFVDHDGIIYANSPTFSDGVFIKFTGGTTTEGSPLKKAFVDKQLFARTLAMIDLLKQFPMNITGVDYGADISINIASIKGIQVGTSSHIVVTNTATEEAIAQSIDLIVNDKAFAAALESKGPQLEYIDLRFPGKIYYKFTQ